MRLFIPGIKRYGHVKIIGLDSIGEFITYENKKRWIYNGSNFGDYSDSGGGVFERDDSNFLVGIMHGSDKNIKHELIIYIIVILKEKLIE